MSLAHWHCVPQWPEQVAHSVQVRHFARTSICSCLVEASACLPVVLMEAKAERPEEAWRTMGDSGEIMQRTAAYGWQVVASAHGVRRPMSKSCIQLDMICLCYEHATSKMPPSTTVIITLLLFAALSFVNSTPGLAAVVNAIDSNPFSLIFKCDHIPSKPDFCFRAESSARLALARIATEFKFRPSSPSGCAYPARLYRVRHKDDGQVFQYPVALLKQLDLAGLDDWKWPDVDIEAECNALENWWFPGDPAVSNSNDFEAVILHETLHGLGWGTVSSIARFPDSVPAVSAASPPTVLPWHESSATLNATVARTNRYMFHRFSDPDIFERFITISSSQQPHPLAAGHGEASSILTYARALNAAIDRLAKEGKLSPLFNNTDVSKWVFKLPDVETALLADAAARSIIAHFTRLATTESTLQFTPSAWAPGASNVPAQSSAPFTLETSFNPFKPASSLNHIQTPDMLRIDNNPNWRTNDSIAGLTPNFIMLPISITASLEDRIKASGAPKSGIGPGIKAALLAMGYTDASADGFVSRQGVAELVGGVGKQGGTAENNGVAVMGGRIHLGIGLVTLAVSLL
ncbi:hypothetical protein BCR44DRAFT_24684 [Catenaria anguillulae PL171]|uniref:Uncharacterized protein n=1 Tax=Catenaria anguillulae PL171 TaxID=765915 RepID=A0A1Y2HWG7_9FUNG|nr:hypothetical protein BCR44DRAFT_24684 [Catenaria anguillulae PL171]